MRLGAPPAPALTLLLAAAVAPLAPAAARGGEVLRCLGPGARVAYTNASCPDGFALDTRWPAREPSGPAPGADAARPAPAAGGGAEGAATTAPEPVDELCAVGVFETRERIGGFDVRFTNRSRRACRGVSYSCLWGVVSSVGFYRQSADGLHEGLVRPGATVELGTIRARGGPADREVVWSWCVPRGPASPTRGTGPAR